MTEETAPKPKKKYNMAERKITNAITGWLKTLDECWWYKVAASSKGGFSFVRPGVPDLCICYKGRTIWVELKSPTGKLSPVQQTEIARMVAAGSEVFVARDLNTVKDILLGV